MSLPLTWADKKNSPLLDEFIAKFGAEYCMTAEEINALRDAVNEMAQIQQSTFLGAAEPAFVPSGTGRAYWIAVKPGTYANHGGVVVAANEIAFIIRDVAGAFSISKTPLDLSTKVNVSDVVNTLVSTETTKPLSAAQGKALNEKIAKGIPNWVAGVYTIGDEVNHLGKDWVSNAATISTDVPGVSSKWVERLSGYTNKSDTTKIFFNPNWSEGSYISPIGGVLLDAAYRATGFIPVLPGAIYKNNINHRICYYNIDKIFISTEGPNNSVTIPGNAYYVRFSTTNAIISFFYDETNVFSNVPSKTDLKIIENINIKNQEVISNIESKLVLNENREGYYSISGNFSADTNYIAENVFKPCRNIKSISFERTLPFIPNGTERIVFYDINKVIIAVFPLSTSVSVPNNSFYYRYSYLLARLKPTIVENNLLKEYVDYGILNQSLKERLINIPINNQGGGIYQADGSFITDSFFVRSEYSINESSPTELYLTTINNNSTISVLFLDASNTTISSLVLPDGLNRDVLLSIPSTTKKIRFNSYKKYAILSYKYYANLLDELDLNYKSNSFLRYENKIHYKDEYYCKVKFKLGVDMESSNIEYDLLNYADLSVRLVCANSTKAYPDSTVNCGIKSNMWGGIRMLNFKPVLEDVFSIRKLGSLQGETTLTVADLNYYVKIGPSEFIIYNGSIEVANLSFISYPKVKDVVNYINTNLSSFFIAKLYQTGDFLMANLSKKEVSLVGYFTNNQGTQILDSAEIFFEKNGIGTVHELEVRTVKLATGYLRTYITINGNFIGQHDGNIGFNRHETLYVGGVNNNLIAPIYIESIVFKKEVPVLKKALIYMMHKLLDAPEGTLQSEVTTADRLFRVITDLKTNGYVFPTANDMISYILKEKSPPDRAAYFIHDDTDIDYETLIKVNDFISKYNIKPMTAIIGANLFSINSENIISQSPQQINLSNQLKTMMTNGNAMISHSFNHISYTKSSYKDVLQDIKNYSKINILGFKTNLMVYPGGACNNYSARLINNNGYCISFTATENAGKEHFYETPYIGYHNLQRTGMQEINTPDYNSVLNIINRDLLRD